MADNDEPEGVWITVAELAKQRGITRQSAAKRVARLESEGLIATVQRGRNRLVELASFDRAVGQTGDAIKEIAARREPMIEPSSTLRDAQTQRAQYDAKLRALEYEERIGNLVPVKGPHGIESALVQTAESILRSFDGYSAWIDKIAEAARKSERDVRAVLRQMVNEQRRTVAGALVKLGSADAEKTRGGVEVVLDDIVARALETGGLDDLEMDETGPV